MFRIAAARLSLIATACCGAASAAETPSERAWDRLPGDTVAALHIPDGSAIAAAIGDSRLGSVLFSEERLQRIEDALTEYAGAQVAEIEGGLEAYGMSREDLSVILAGETGLAVQLLPALEAGGDPRVTGLAWLTPGEIVAGKLVDLVDRLVADQQEKADTAITRIDEEMAGRSVIHLTRREQTTTFRWDKETGQAVEETRFGDPEHLYLHRDGGRIFLGYAPDTAFDATARAFQDLITGTDLAGGSFGAKLDTVLGLQEARPSGEQLFEFAGYLPPLWDLLRQMPGPMIDGGKLVEHGGLDGLTAIQMAASIEGELAQWNGFVAAPAPRVGFLALLDQPDAESGVPSWAPAEAIQFVRTGVDAASSWATLRETIISIGGQQVAMGIQAADAQMQGMFGVADIATLLEGLGRDMMWIGMPTPAEVVRGMIGMTQNDHGALVWELADQQTWATFVERLAQLGIGQGAPIQVDERHGFSGAVMDLTLQGPGMPYMAIHTGHGKLVLSIGKGVDETILGRIADPEGATVDSLADSELVARSRELVDLDAPCTTWSVTDLDAQVGTLAGQLRSAFQMMAQMGQEEMEVVVDLIPSADELQGTLGYQASRLVVDEQGVTLETVSELPRAESMPPAGD